MYEVVTKREEIDFVIHCVSHSLPETGERIHQHQIERHQSHEIIFIYTDVYINKYVN